MKKSFQILELKCLRTFPNKDGTFEVGEKETRSEYATKNFTSVFRDERS
jgi:hypothetical protein